MKATDYEGEERKSVSDTFSNVNWFSRILFYPYNSCQFAPYKVK